MRHLSYLREGRKAAAWRVAAPVLAALLLVIGGDQSPTIPGESFIGAPTGPATPAASPVPPSWEFGTVPNAYSMSLTADAGTGRQPVTASWTYIDGLPGLNAQIDSWLLDILDAKTAPAGGRYRPAMALSTPPGRAPGPGTTLTAQPVQASGTVIVFRETEKDTAPDGTSTLTAGTVYADTGTGEVHRAADLFRPESLSGIRSLAAEAVNHNAGPTPAETTLSDVLLNDDGAIQVSTARPGIKNLESAAVTVTVGATDAGSALSDFGLHVLSQIRSRAPVAAAPASPPGLRHINCDIIPCASLTYDDGPDPKTTPQLLGILKEKNVSATFFMQGTNASANPGTAKQVTDAGHTVGNHTFSHPNLTKLSAAGVRSEIDRAGAAIRAATGTLPTFMRPPYGAANAAVQGAVGMPLILWSVDSLDWLSKNPAVFVPKVLKEITPGGVVIMHDVHATTIAGQDELITTLQTRGYHLVTVQELFEGTPLTPGRIYRSRPERQ